MQAPDRLHQFGEIVRLVDLLDRPELARVEFLERLARHLRHREQPLLFGLLRLFGQAPHLRLAARFHGLHGETGPLRDPLGRLDAAQTGDRRQLVRLGVGDLVERAPAELEHRLGHVEPDALDLGHLSPGLLLEVAHLRLRVDVDAPARELRGEPHVLPLLAYSQRQLFVGDDELHRVRLGVDEHARDLGRRDRVAHKARRVRIPRHDVDLLAAQLLHDRLHARALHADAGAHRIDIAILAGDGDLGAGARLARARLNAHDLLVDLRDLLLEELLEQPLVRARQDDLRAARGAIDVDDVRDEAIARAVRLAGHLLARRQDRLGLAEVDDDVAALEAAHDARHELALAILELVIDHVALRLAEALDDDLLGGLRGNAAEAEGRRLEAEQLRVLLVVLDGLIDILWPIEDLEEQLVTDVGLEPTLARRLDGDVAARHLDLGDHVVHEKEIDPAGLGVVARLELVLLAEGLLGGGEDRLLEGLDDRLLVDSLVLGHLIQDEVEISLHAQRPFSAGRPEASHSYTTFAR